MIKRLLSFLFGPQKKLEPKKWKEDANASLNNKRIGSWLNTIDIIIDYMPDGMMAIYDVDVTGEMFNFELNHWDKIVVSDDKPVVRTYPPIPMDYLDIIPSTPYDEKYYEEALKEYIRLHYQFGAGLICIRKSNLEVGLYRTAIDYLALEELRILSKEW